MLGWYFVTNIYFQKIVFLPLAYFFNMFLETCSLSALTKEPRVDADEMRRMFCVLPCTEARLFSKTRSAAAVAEQLNFQPSCDSPGGHI